MENNQKTIALNSDFFCLNYGLAEYKTYLFSLVMIAGSVMLPYVLHYFYSAGQIFLPIYFFVLIGAYKFGWKVGVMTAISSVLISFALTGMPMLMILPFVIIKGVLLAITAGYFAKRGKLSMLSILLTIACYQVVGFAIVYLFSHNLALASEDLVSGYPGLLLEIIGGYLLLKSIRGYGRKELETNSK